MEVVIWVVIALAAVAIFMKVLRKIVKFLLFIIISLWVYNTFFAKTQALSVEMMYGLC